MMAAPPVRGSGHPPHLGTNGEGKKLYWTTGQAPLRTAAGSSVKILDIPANSVVEGGQVLNMPYNGMRIDWVHVKYQAAKYFEGWVYKGYLEEYEEEFDGDVVPIENDTPNPADAAQYMIWKGQTQFNMCGELCACYCFDISGEIPTLELLLTQWEAKQVGIFRRVFGSGGRARGTDLGELDSMLSVFGYDTPSVRLAEALKDPVLNRPLVTPRRMAKLLEEHQIILGVKIDGALGNLRGQGIGHWVVVDSIMPDGINGGYVHLYNPFPNRKQDYSWRELTASMGSPYGILVKR